LASKGISIPIASDTRDFSQGIKSGVIKPLEGVEDALDDVAREGDHAGDKLEDSMKDASRKTEALEKDYKELGQTIRDEAYKSSRAQKQANSETTTNTKAGLTEIKAEALANASETFSSFDGTATSFASGIQGTFGGLIASIGPLLGPAGLLAAVAGAAGVGLITSSLGLSEEKSEEFRQKVAELTGQFIDAGNTGKRSFSSIVDDISKLATETDDSKTNLKDLKDIAKTLGVPFKDVVTAYEQGGKALDDLLATNRKLKDAEDERYRASVDADSAAAYSATAAESAKYGVELDGINTTLSDQKQLLEDAAVAAQVAAAAGLTDLQLKADLIGQVDGAYDDAAGAVDTYINKETLVFDTAAYITAMQQREQALKDYQDTLNTADLSPEAKKFLESQGQDAAASFLQGYKGAAPDQKAELNRIWTEAGKTNSAEYSTTVQKEFDAADALKVKAPVIDPIPTAKLLADAQRELDKTPLKIKAINVDAYGRKIQ
jgi:hypothetical protein